MQVVIILRQVKLLFAKEYQLVFKYNRKRVIGQGFVGFYKPNCLGFARLGIVVAKKHVRKAVHRNYIKRLIRESFQVYRELSPYDFIIKSKKNLHLLQGKQILQNLNSYWDQFKS